MKKTMHSLMDAVGSSILLGPLGQGYITKLLPATPLKELDLSPVKHALVIAPHPDDEIFGSALLLKQLSARNVNITIIFVTNGQKYKTSLTGDRVEEANASTQKLKANAHFLNFMDGELQHHQPELTAALRGHLVNVDLVVAPAWNEYHQDHRAVSRAVLRAIKPSDTFRLLLYCTFTPLWPDYPITYLQGTLACIEEPMKCYVSSASRRGVHSFNVLRQMHCRRYLGTQGFWEPYWELECAHVNSFLSQAEVSASNNSPVLKTPSHGLQFLKNLRSYSKAKRT